MRRLSKLGNLISSLANPKNLYVTVPLLLCFTLYLRAISKYNPPGAYIWRGLFSEFYGIIIVLLLYLSENN